MTENICSFNELNILYILTMNFTFKKRRDERIKNIKIREREREKENKAREKEKKKKEKIYSFYVHSFHF